MSAGEVKPQPATGAFVVTTKSRGKLSLLLPPPRLGSRSRPEFSSSKTFCLGFRTCIYIFFWCGWQECKYIQTIKRGCGTATRGGKSTTDKTLLFIKVNVFSGRPQSAVRQEVQGVTISGPAHKHGRPQGRTEGDGGCSLEIRGGKHNFVLWRVTNECL